MLGFIMKLFSLVLHDILLVRQVSQQVGENVWRTEIGKGISLDY